MTKSIAIITSGQPSANPRVVKEASAFYKYGYNVTVVYAPLSHWADEFDKDIFTKQPGIKWIVAGYHPVNNALFYKLARVRLAAYKKIYSLFPSLIKDHTKAFVLFSQELSKASLNVKADLYIGHNIGSLPAVINAAKKNNAKCAFDAEDYHYGEFTDEDQSKQLAKKIEDNFLPLMSYISAASPLIAKAYSIRFPSKKIEPINNVFSIEYLQSNISNSNPGELKLFWFSQKAGPGRGIETVTEASSFLKDCNISLHILGNCSNGYKEQLKNTWQCKGAVNFIDPVNPGDIFKIANQFDAGLATEIPSCINRDICLTNKIFSYMLAGLCIVASDTAAQKKLLTENEGAGLLYNSSNAEDLAEKLKFLYGNREYLLACKKKSIQLAQTIFNWELESARLISLVQETVLN